MNLQLEREQKPVVVEFQPLRFTFLMQIQMIQKNDGMLAEKGQIFSPNQKQVSVLICSCFSACHNLHWISVMKSLAESSKHFETIVCSPILQYLNHSVFSFVQYQQIFNKCWRHDAPWQCIPEWCTVAPGSTGSSARSAMAGAMQHPKSPPARLVTSVHLQNAVPCCLPCCENPWKEQDLILVIPSSHIIQSNTYAKNHIHLKFSEIHSLIILSGSLQTPGRSNKVEQAPNFSTAFPPIVLDLFTSARRCSNWRNKSLI